MRSTSGCFPRYASRPVRGKSAVDFPWNLWAEDPPFRQEGQSMRMVAVAVVVMLAGCVTPQQQAMPSQFPEPEKPAPDIRRLLVEAHIHGAGMMKWIDSSQQADWSIRDCLAQALVTAMTDKEIRDYLSPTAKQEDAFRIYMRVNPIATDECRR